MNGPNVPKERPERFERSERFERPERSERLEAKLHPDLHPPSLRRGRRLPEEPRRHRPRVAREIDAVEDVVGLREEFEIAAGRRRATLRRAPSEREAAAEAHAQVSPARRAARA